jgi:8-oxo-dGTP pyrophosphatase MutT (NUDIX family)
MTRGKHPPNTSLQALSGIRAKRLKRLAAGVQYGVLPFRVADDGAIRILLLTSRETHRWVIPKGWPMSKHKARETAAQEAWEEAGVVGRIIGKRPLGTYGYQKRLSPSVSIACTVKVFLLLVDQQMDDWPEKGERKTEWFETMEAAALVDEAALADIMLKLGAKLRRFRRKLGNARRGA